MENKRRKEKQERACQTCIFTGRENKEEKHFFEIKTAGHIRLNHSSDMILLVWQLKHSSTEVEVNVEGDRVQRK